ncbi:MAG TPA: hypothetical protein VFI64_06865 [Nitrososphaeraceae archaeon]|nr:hypothetical protein [Nitrososphaeraceae archaeon]
MSYSEQIGIFSYSDSGVNKDDHNGGMIAVSSINKLTHCYDNLSVRRPIRYAT